MHRRADFTELQYSSKLRDYPFDMVRLSCPKCGRNGQYRKAKLLERFGPDQNMVDLRLILAEGCPRIPAPSISEHCGVIYPDLVGK